MEKLIAYNGSKELKDDILAEAIRHQEADKIVQGTYGEKNTGEDFKGCAVGCTINSYNLRRGKHEKTNDHSVYERDLGIPRILARLEDRLFEGLSVKESKSFPVRFLEAIEPGADLSMVWPKFIIWVLADPEHGVIKFARPDGKKAIERVVELYKQKIDGADIDRQVWNDAAAAYATTDATTDATTYAAYAAAYATTTDATTYATYAAAYAAYAADAAAYAADAAADAADAAARRNHYKLMADKLIELLKEAK